VRHKKVLEANIDETQGLLEQIVAHPIAQWQGDVENLDTIEMFHWANPKKKNRTCRIKNVMPASSPFKFKIDGMNDIGNKKIYPRSQSEIVVQSD